MVFLSFVTKWKDRGLLSLSNAQGGAARVRVPSPKNNMRPQTEEKSTSTPREESLRSRYLVILLSQKHRKSLVLK